MFSEEINQKIAGWEAELQDLTHDSRVKLRPVIVQQSEIKVTLDDIAEICAYAAETTVEAIIGKSRKGNIKMARQILYHFAYKRGIGNYTQIGQYLSGRDHTTVMAGIQRLKDMLDTNDDAYVRAFGLAEYCLNKYQEKLGGENANG